MVSGGTSGGETAVQRWPFLPRPPVKLTPPPARLRPFLTLLWFACLAGAVFAQAGASWRLYVFQSVTNPAFAALGLDVLDVDAPNWRAKQRSDAARRAGITRGVRVVAVDGLAVDEDARAEDVARGLARRAAPSVRLTLRAPGAEAAQVVPLVRSDSIRDEVFARQDRNWRIFTQGVDLALAGLLLVVAGLLRWRRPKDPVAILLSFALLFLATLGCWRLWEWLRFESMPIYLDIIWLSLLLVALPALPSGRYVPTWSRWFMLLGPAAAILLAWHRDGSAKLDNPPEVAVMGGIVLAVLISVVLRFVETPSGSERQRMKWASLGFGLGVMLAFFGDNVAEALPRELAFAERYLSFVLTRTGYAIMPLGLLFSVVGYRLNDVDAAIGRTASYAAVTILVGVVWGVGTHYSNQIIATVARERSEGIAIAISSVVALALFTPAKARMLAWAEVRFQGALLRLRSLPERIARWQNDDNPHAVAERALVALAECVDARHAALIREAQGDEVELLAVYKISPEAVRASLAKRKPRKRSADDFPLRLQTHHQAGPPVTLLVGPRNDGAFYSKKERSAVSAIAEPLADAIHAVSRRAAHESAIMNALGEINHCLEEMQTAAARPPRRRPPGRPA